MTSIHSPALVDGPQLLELFGGAAAYLQESAKAVDAINVYPVPDGDTGSNMAATLREAVDNARATPGPLTAATVLHALAHGALYGARGNSGVILSQALRGLADALATFERLDAAGLAAGLTEAANLAYGAVAKPVEGTMLTVLRAAADGATGAALALPDGGRGVPCGPTLASAVRAAEVAEAGTPDQLPALAEAGVTDAGGEGVCVILRGLLAALTGERFAPPAMPARPIAQLAGHESEQLGFCTEFLLEREAVDLDLGALREFAGRGSNRSVVVVGDVAAARVHVHSDDPETLLKEAALLGRVVRPKIEDMAAQNARFGATGSGAGAKTAVLAMSPGPGFDAVFESLGARPCRMGDIVKPAARDIAAAADALRVADVIVLPNHTNVIMAARQAAAIAACTITVVPTESVPQGIAAALAADPSLRASENAEAMDQAMNAVRTIEVTTAAVDRAADGVTVRAGQGIVLVDGTLIAAAPTLEAAFLKGLAGAAADDAALLTIYTGTGVRDEDTRQLTTAIRLRYPTLEVEVVEGGQQLYPYIAAVES
jgi:uncharacterized protein